MAERKNKRGIKGNNEGKGLKINEGLGCNPFNEQDNIKDFVLSDFMPFFLIHRRVMGVMYHSHDLNGYEIEMLLVLLWLSGYNVDTPVSGGDIRRHVSKRFQNVVKGILSKLEYRGYVSVAEKSKLKKHFVSVSVTDEGLKFAYDFRACINELMSQSNVQLSLNHRMKWEKRKELDKQ
jgi:hypothetical protein